MLAKESVAPKRRSSAAWMPERIGRWSVGVGRRHPVTMGKASFKALCVCVCVYPSSSLGWRYGMNGNSGSCRQPN